MSDHRRYVPGYALLAVLWMCVGIGGFSLLISAAAREAIATSHNRVAIAAAVWNAAGCAVHVHAILAAAEADSAAGASDPVGVWWERADRVLRATPPPPRFHCVVTARPVGARLDVNTGDQATLARLFRLVGMRDGQADSAAAALSDWKDSDEVARPLGAERHWYQAHHRPAPSNRRIQSLRELRLVRGLEAFPALDSVLDVEPGPIALNVARPPVLALLPGFSAEAEERVMDVRRHDAVVHSFKELGDMLSPSSRATLEGASARLGAAATLYPTAWVLTLRSSAGAPAISVANELRVVNATGGVVTTRSRSWIE